MYVGVAGRVLIVLHVGLGGACSWPCVALLADKFANFVDFWDHRAWNTKRMVCERQFALNTQQLIRTHIGYPQWGFNLSAFCMLECVYPSTALPAEWSDEGFLAKSDFEFLLETFSISFACKLFFFFFFPCVEVLWELFSSTFQRNVCRAICDEMWGSNFGHALYICKKNCVRPLLGASLPRAPKLVCSADLYLVSCGVKIGKYDSFLVLNAVPGQHQICFAVFSLGIRFHWHQQNTILWCF